MKTKEEIDKIVQDMAAEIATWKTQLRAGTLSTLEKQSMFWQAMCFLTAANGIDPTYIFKLTMQQKEGVIMHEDALERVFDEYAKNISTGVQRVLAPCSCEGCSSARHNDERLS